MPTQTVPQIFDLTAWNNEKNVCNLFSTADFLQNWPECKFLSPKYISEPRKYSKIHQNSNLLPLKIGQNWKFRSLEMSRIVIQNLQIAKKSSFRRSFTKYLTVFDFQHSFQPLWRLLMDHSTIFHQNNMWLNSFTCFFFQGALLFSAGWPVGSMALWDEPRKIRQKSLQINNDTNRIVIKFKLIMPI